MRFILFISTILLSTSVTAQDWIGKKQDYIVNLMNLNTNQFHEAHIYSANSMSIVFKESRDFSIMHTFFIDTTDYCTGYSYATTDVKLASDMVNSLNSKCSVEEKNMVWVYKKEDKKFTWVAYKSGKYYIFNNTEINKSDFTKHK